MNGATENMKNHEDSGLGIRKSTDTANGYPNLDNRSRSEIEVARKALKDEIDEMANGGCGAEDLIEKKDKLKHLENYLKSGNQPDSTSQNEKSRTNVYKRIEEARKKITKKMPYTGC